MFRPLAAAMLVALTTPAAADDVVDTLNSAIAAYDAGDIAYALEEIAFAAQLLQAMKAGTLATLLPEPLDGWTREVDEDEGRALGMMGGTAAVARYGRGDERFTLQIVANSPMVATFAGIFGNAAMMANMGRIERVGREKFLNQDGDLTGVVGGRILVQAQGGPVPEMIAHLETIDYKALSDFGS